MNAYAKPKVWSDPKNKLFAHQVGLTAPPCDWDAASTDFLRIAPQTVGVCQRLMHVPNYAHTLENRSSNFHLLEEFVECMANAGADVCGQVGTNWPHAAGMTPEETAAFCDRLSDTYETPFHMMALCVIEALRDLGAERIAVNNVYYWPDWRDGFARFLRQAGFDVVYAGNFVDLGIYPTQEDSNAQVWVFPGDVATRSMARLAEQAPNVDAYVVSGVPNFRRQDGLPQRVVALVPELEELVGKPIVASDTALYWRLFKTIGVAPLGDRGKLLSSLQ